MRKVETDQARQGRSGRRVLVILVAAMVLALIVFAGLGLYGSSLPDENIGSVEQSGATSEPVGGADTTAADGAVVSPSEAPPSPPTAPTVAPPAAN